MFAHIAEYADGWIPIGGAGLPRGHAPPPGGRGRGRPRPRGARDRAVRVVPDAAKLEHFAEIGVTECVFRLPSAPADDVLPVLDSFAAMVSARR